MALRVEGPIGAVAVELVLGLGGDGGAGGPGPFAVLVDVFVEAYMDALSVDASS